MQMFLRFPYSENKRANQAFHLEVNVIKNAGTDKNHHKSPHTSVISRIKVFDSCVYSVAYLIAPARLCFNNSKRVLSENNF